MVFRSPWITLPANACPPTCALRVFDAGHKRCAGLCLPDSEPDEQAGPHAGVDQVDHHPGGGVEVAGRRWWS
jgi:hypothetical protein